MNVGQRIRVKPGLQPHTYPDPNDRGRMLSFPVSGRTGVVTGPKEKSPGVQDPGIWNVRLDVIDNLPDWAKEDGWLNTSYHEMWLEPETQPCTCPIQTLMRMGCQCGSIRK